MEKNVENYEKLNNWIDEANTIITTLEKAKKENKTIDDILNEYKKARDDWANELEDFENDNLINEER